VLATLITKETREGESEFETCLGNIASPHNKKENENKQTKKQWGQTLCCDSL
jgi:hypothetical protein